MEKHKLKIGAHRIDVYSADEEHITKIHISRDGEPPPKNESIQGVYFGPNTIVICEKYDNVYEFGIYLHEIMEALNYLYELSLPHHKITVIGEAFTQVLYDNRKRIIKLLEKLK